MYGYRTWSPLLEYTVLEAFPERALLGYADQDGQVMTAPIQSGAWHAALLQRQ
jgi:hypothetical protein